MRSLAVVALTLAFSSPALCADLMFTKSKHTGAFPGREAQDTTETTWIGKDRLRTQDGDRVTIVRADLGKLYVLDTQAKTYSALDLPVDMKKYLEPDKAPMYERMLADTKVVVTPSTDTKKVREWNATRYTLTITMPSPMGDMITTQEVWATKDVPIDRAAWDELYGALMTMAPGGASMATEMKKIEGLPVLIERTQKMMGNEIKSTEEVTEVVSKDAPEGAYEVPKDFVEKPFDPTSQMGPPGGRRGGRAKPAGSDKPADGEKRKEGEEPKEREKRPVPPPKQD